MSLQPVKLNLKVYQGSTFAETLRWETSTKVYIPITNISKSAPIVVTADNHGVPEGWRIKISGTQGMKELVAYNDYLIATGITTNTITVNSINALGFTTYTGGGVVEYNQPADLSGYTARMQIREKVSSDVVLYELTTTNGGILINNTLKTLTLSIPASVTTGFSFSSGVYSLELVNGLVVEPFIYGTITLEKEVTR